MSTVKKRKAATKPGKARPPGEARKGTRDRFVKAMDELMTYRRKHAPEKI